VANDSFSIDPMMVNSATMGMNSLVGAGNNVTKGLQIISPVIFAEIGSGVATSNAALENALAQSLMSALSLFGNTSSNVQAAASTYTLTDGETASNISGLSSGLPSGNLPLTDPPVIDAPLTNVNIPVEANPAWPADATLADEGLPSATLADEGLPSATLAGESMIGALAEDAGGLAEASSSVLARLSAAGGSLLGEEGDTIGSDLSLSSRLRLSGAGGSLLGEDDAVGSDLSLSSRFSAQTSAVSEAWNGLSANEQQAMIEADPDAIGSLDGIPSEVRNYVNRGDLDDLAEDTEGQIEELRSSASQADDDEDDKKASAFRRQAAILAMQLGGLRALQRQLRANKNAYLLAADTDSIGIGRFIVAINNPDTANNVATLVPAVELGLNETGVSGIDGEGGYLAAAMNLAAAASNADPSQKTSVVVWANSASQFAPTRTFVPDPKAALTFSKFQNGLRSANVNGSGLHATVIGNRAGSTVVGDAAKLPGGLGADDVIVLGHPGLDASTTASLAIRADSSTAGEGPHVWAYSNDSDDQASASPVGGTAADTDFFSPDSPVMPDMANVIIGNYENIYHLSKQ
jgi:Alpha/beta hydrolase